MRYQEYHPDWKDVIRPQILKRDGYQCQHCGIRHKALVYRKSDGQYHECDNFEYEWAKANGRKPFKMFLNVCHLDHDKGNNEAANLLSLCPRCHGKMDKSHKNVMRKIYKAKIEKLPTAHIVRVKYAVREVLELDISEVQAEMIYNLITKTK